MKIQELEITKIVKRTGDPPEILQQAGWQVLGYGVDGAVGQHPTKPLAVKLYNSRSSYSDFVDYVQSHESNPHLPRFVRYIRDVPGTHLSYVVLEKLQDGGLYQLVKTHPGEILSLYVIAKKMNRVTIQAEYQFLLDMLRLPQLPQFEELATVYQKLRIQPPSQEWTQAVMDLAVMSRKRGLGWDLDEKNVMLRGNTLVITDPFYNDTESYTM